MIIVNIKPKVLRAFPKTVGSLRRTEKFRYFLEWKDTALDGGACSSPHAHVACREAETIVVFVLQRRQDGRKGHRRVYDYKNATVEEDRASGRSRCGLLGSIGDRYTIPNKNKGGDKGGLKGLTCSPSPTQERGQGLGGQAVRVRSMMAKTTRKEAREPSAPPRLHSVRPQHT